LAGNLKNGMKINTEKTGKPENLTTGSLDFRLS